MIDDDSVEKIYTDGELPDFLNSTFIPLPKSSKEVVKM